MLILSFVFRNADFDGKMLSNVLTSNSCFRHNVLYRKSYLFCVQMTRFLWLFYYNLFKC